MIKKFLLIILTVLLLTGCSTFDVITHPLERQQLNISSGEPLSLEPVVWTIIQKDGKVYYGLDPINYSHLSINTEKVQNRLSLDEQIIKKQHDYYTNQ